MLRILLACAAALGASFPVHATDTAPADASVLEMVQPAEAVPAMSAPPAYEPAWVTEEQFEKQLLLVHGKPIDPKMGLFGPRSQMWRISRFTAPGLLGSGRALTLQIAHPWVTAGIDEHSITRNDPLKRGRDTFRYITTMIYGDRDQALQAARDVRMIHEKIRGHMPYEAGVFVNGSEYRANEEQAMIWVHATLWETLMIMYEDAIGPVSDVDKEKYYQETKLFAYLFGIREEALPKHWPDFVAYCEDMRNSDRLVVTPASKELAGFLFGVRGVGPILWLPMQYEKAVTAMYLPEDLRKGYGFGTGPVRRAMVKSTLWMSRVGHKITPGGLTKNPVHKEAVARIANKKAGWFTRFELWVAFGNSRLVNDK